MLEILDKHQCVGSSEASYSGICDGQLISVNWHPWKQVYPLRMEFLYFDHPAISSGHFIYELPKVYVHAK